MYVCVAVCSEGGALCNTNMTSPFHTFPRTPSIDVDVFLTKVRQYRQYCEVISVRDQIYLCRDLEVCVDAELTAILQESALHPASSSLETIPTDMNILMKMTRDTWRVELLHKLKYTLKKITELL